MAGLTVAGITFTTTTGVKTVAATPVLGDLIVVVVGATGVASGLGVSDNNPDGHGNYTQITSAVKNTSADELAAFVRADPIRSASATTWTTSGDAASTGGGLVVLRISAMSLCGPVAVRQSGAQSNAAASSTPTVPLGVGAALTTNLLIAAVLNATSPATITQPTSWVEDEDVGYSTPTTGLEVCHIVSGFTGSSVAFGATSGSAFCAIAFELDTRSEQPWFATEGEEHGSAFTAQVMDRVGVVRGGFF